MTPRQELILAAMCRPLKDRPWRRPREFGADGFNGYATTAQQMAKKGWVEVRECGGRNERKHWLYRATPLGRMALANHRALKEAAEKQGGR